MVNCDMSVVCIPSVTSTPHPWKVWSDFPSKVWWTDKHFDFDFCVENAKNKNSWRTVRTILYVRILHIIIETYVLFHLLLLIRSIFSKARFLGSVSKSNPTRSFKTNFLITIPTTNSFATSSKDWPQIISRALRHNHSRQQESPTACDDAATGRNRILGFGSILICLEFIRFDRVPS